MEVAGEEGEVQRALRAILDRVRLDEDGRLQLSGVDG